MKDIINSIILKNKDEYIKHFSNCEFNQKIKNSWEVLYNLVYMEWYDGIKYFAENGGNINLLSKDFCGNTSGVPIYTIGGQNVLFILDDLKMMQFLLNLGVKEIIDNNGNSHNNYLKYKNDFETYKKNYHQVLLRCDKLKCICKLENIILTNDCDDCNIIKEFKFIGDIKNYLNFDELLNDKVENTNSMHKKSINIYITDEVKKIIKFVLDDNITVTEIIGFYVSYDTRTERNIEKHTDDSIITINICLENSSDSILILNDNINVTLKKNHIYVHRGNISHYTTKCNIGIKKNIIIWLK